MFNVKYIYSNLLNKINSNLSRIGFFGVLIKILKYPLIKINQRKISKIFSNISIKDRFTLIYKTNHWDCCESISGVGSSLEQTVDIRKNLPILFKRFHINKITDGPCGDFNWMKLVLNELEVEYIGVDIVEPLIIKLNKMYSKDNRNFICINLLEDEIPHSDLHIARDFLFHLSFSDILNFLLNFRRSKTPYLLTTTHINDGFNNSDIITGNFRKIDLFKYPFHFPKDVIFRFNDYKFPQPPREMCLWNADQIDIVIFNLSKYSIK